MNRISVTRLIKRHIADGSATLGTPNRREMTTGLNRKEKSAVIRNARKNPSQTLKELAEYGCGVRPLCTRTVLSIGGSRD